MRAAAARLVVAGLLALLVGCDHGTKFIAKAELEGQHPHDLIHGVLDLQYAENRDVAFNLLRWIPEGIRVPILIVGGALALLVLAAVLVRHRPALSVARAALVLVTAGAFGNYVDRIARGYVVDFIHIHHWPVFNVADVYVTAGAMMLVLSTFRAQRTRSEA
jgi:signal peptidase II